MVPLTLAVPLTLYVQMGFKRYFRGKFALDRRPLYVDKVSSGTTVNEGSGFNNLSFQQPA